jgi:hypothetical protein
VSIQNESPNNSHKILETVAIPEQKPMFAHEFLLAGKLLNGQFTNPTTSWAKDC